MHVFAPANQWRQLPLKSRSSLRLYLNVDPAMFLQAAAQVSRRAFNRVVVLDNPFHDFRFRIALHAGVI